MKLIGRDRFMIILDDGFYLKIYLEPFNLLAHTLIHDKRILKRISLENLGSQLIFAFDESNRLFTMLSITKVRSSVVSLQ